MLELLVLLNLMQFALILILLRLFFTKSFPQAKKQTPNRHLMAQRLPQFPDPTKAHRLRRRWNEAVQVALAAAPEEQSYWQ